MVKLKGMENKITKIFAEEINDSRGNPTIKVTVSVSEARPNMLGLASSDISDSFSVPSGASTGAHEAHVIENSKAILNVNEIIAKALIGQDILNQKEIDRIMLELDGTNNKDNLGGNSMIGVSIACAKTAAKVLGVETYEHLRTLMEIKPSRKTPYLFMNLLEGGKHIHNGFDLAFQEYHIVPETEDVKEALDIGIKISNTLKEILQENGSVEVGDEGGDEIKSNDIRKPLELLIRAIKENNLENEVHLALDVAASSFYENGKYRIDKKENTKEELADIYESLIKEFNLFSIEDPFDEEDFESFAKLKQENDNLFIVGDDLTVTNKILLEKAIEKGSIGAMIIKPNQIGTLYETLETMRLARENDIELIVSHRSGETEDAFIADLAFAFNCFGLKAGAPTKPERMVKYERLIKIINNS
jgi:enolase